MLLCNNILFRLLPFACILLLLFDNSSVVIVSLRVRLCVGYVSHLFFYILDAAHEPSFALQAEQGPLNCLGRPSSQDESTGGEAEAVRLEGLQIGSRCWPDLIPRSHVGGQGRRCMLLRSASTCMSTSACLHNCYDSLIGGSHYCLWVLFVYSIRPVYHERQFVT